MKKSIALVACAGFATCALAHPGTGLQHAPWSGEKVAAQRAMKVMKGADGQIIPLSGWVDLNPVSREGASSTYLWDGFEQCPREEGAPPVGFVGNTENGTGCDGVVGAGNRWWFGADYFNPHFVSDFQEAVPGDVAHVNIAASYQPLASSGLVIAIFTWDDCSLDGLFLPNGDVVDGFVSGVILDYGALPPITGGWAYFTAINLPAGFLTVPADGEGGFEFIYAESFDGTTFTLHADAAGDGGGVQPMLWGTGEHNTPVQLLDRVGRSTEVQHDDDNPLNGIFDADINDPTFCVESYSYAFGVAPNPLGACFAVFAKDGDPGCPADFNGDGFLDFFDLDAFVEAFENGDPSADFNDDGFLDFFDLDAFVEAFEAGC
ncbi:MAG: EF-hand domain-containing protein [Phycisphaeraceae bacterium]|nr:MAG: EF-hand domain-containing protein [Phycisphaeraceae bacterium]